MRTGFCDHLGANICESLQRNVWRGVVSPLKVVSLPYIALQRFAMFALWRSHNPVGITKSPITEKSFIVTAKVTKRPGRGTAIYMGYIGICGCERYGLQPVYWI